MSEADQDRSARLWVPDNPDGSGWADVDWGSVLRGTRYHYRHAGSMPEARAEQPSHYLVVTRLESPRLRPHENRYYVARELLSDSLAELALTGGAEIIWHVEPCPNPPPESKVATSGNDAAG